MIALMRLGDICTITKGEIGIMKAIQGEYCMIGLGEEDKTHNEYQFDAKAVIVPLISSTGHGSATMKRVKYYEGKFALGTILCAVIPNDENVVLAKYLHLYLHENRNDLLVPLMKGAANVTLPIKRLYDVIIPIPSIQEQKRFIELEEDISNRVKRLNLEISLQKEYLAKLKQSILQDAICGKLTEDWREANPNIEPASELLKRIKAEKQRQIKEGEIRKEKPLDPITDTDLPFHIPPTWQWCRLGDLINFVSGNNFNSGDFLKNDGAKCIKITNVGVGELIDTDDVLPFEFLEKFNQYIVNENDIVIALTRPYIASGLKVCKCNNKYDSSLLNQRVAVLKCVDKSISEYTYQFMTSQYVLVLFKNMFDSVGQQPNLKKEHITDLLMPLLPIEEQKRIVEIIKNSLEKCRLIAAQLTANEQTAQNLTKSILSETFSNN